MRHDGARRHRGLDDLYRTHSLGLIRFALMLTGDQATAEEVVQEAFPGRYRGWARLADPGHREAVVRGVGVRPSAPDGALGRSGSA